jgi:hypothetical protein
MNDMNLAASSAFVGRVLLVSDDMITISVSPCNDSRCP